MEHMHGRLYRYDVSSEEKKIAGWTSKSEGITESDIKMLLDLPTLTEERRKELELSIEKMVKERAVLVTKSDVDMWMEDMAKLTV